MLHGTQKNPGASYCQFLQSQDPVNTAVLHATGAHSSRPEIASFMTGFMQTAG